MTPPDFWYPQVSGSRPGLWAKAIETLLRPLGAIYGAAGQAKRVLSTSYRANVPVVCVGNLSVGGTGKTPVSIAIASMLGAFGHQPFFLTRGYGGTEKGPIRVDQNKHRAAQVGDEPLLLASSAPTIVSRDRPAGAALAEQQGASIIVMDDGFQNPSLVKDAAFVVVDCKAGFGNGLVFPAGPLRESVSEGLRRAEAIIAVGSSPQSDASHISKAIAEHAQDPPPLLKAHLKPAASGLKPHPYLAFAGIGRPEKFFSTLRDLEAELVTTRAFPDHHMYTNQELDDLRRLAAQRGAKLITTEKDAMRLSPEWRRMIETLPVELHFEDRKALEDLLQKKLSLTKSPLH